MRHTDSVPPTTAHAKVRKTDSTGDVGGGARGEFDALALYREMDAKRLHRGLSWREAAQEIWDQSATLNRRGQDHPISPSTLTGIAKRGDCTCQHALFILRWLALPPERFLTIPQSLGHATTLPEVGPEHRLRWDLAKLYSTLDAQRHQKDLKWAELVRKLRCTANQLTRIRTARFAIGMKLAMRITQWLRHPANTFIYAAKW
jgi:hypothetical protein